MKEDEPFREMAGRIAKIDPQEFAGAAVIQPPDGGEPIAFLIAEAKPDLLQFWAAVKARVEIAYAALVDEASAQPGGWNRR